VSCHRTAGSLLVRDLVRICEVVFLHVVDLLPSFAAEKREERRRMVAAHSGS